jgi:hypothetical protein
MSFGTSEQTRRLVEVTALIGLLNWGSTTVESMEIKKKSLKKLKDFAFPEEIEVCNHHRDMFHMEKCPNCDKEF